MPIKEQLIQIKFDIIEFFTDFSYLMEIDNFKQGYKQIPSEQGFLI